MQGRKNEFGMKILHVIQNLKMGGIEKLVLSMAQRDPVNVYILAIEGNAEQSIEAWPILANYRSNLVFANKGTGFKTDIIAKIKQTCQKYSITVIHSHHIGPLLYSSFARLTMKPIRHIHTEHDVWYLNAWKNRWIQTVLLKLNRNVSLVAVSQYVLDKLQMYFPAKKITLIPNAVDTKRFQPGDRQLARLHFNLPSSPVILGTAGRLEGVKGQRFLIEAMMLLPDNFYLAIAGQGQLYPTLMMQVQHLGLAQRVCFLGVVEEMELFYQACDLFCLPSLNEGLPLSLLEAQACNVPVVCSDVGGCYEGVDPDSGYLVPSMDAKAIASTCLEWRQKKAKPREFILKNFSIEPLLEKYNRLYMKDL